ncbi:MAG: hypothetical protein FWF97_04305 [Alphaproteobacteria bacterium]|nr:hypothetical protein [Alphaproteobacteria bacterium]
MLTSQEELNKKFFEQLHDVEFLKKYIAENVQTDLAFYSFIKTICVLYHEFREAGGPVSKVYIVR